MYINNDSKPSDFEPNSPITGLDNRTETESIESLGIIANKIIKMPGKILLTSALLFGMGINFAEANITPQYDNLYEINIEVSTNQESNLEEESKKTL